MAFECVKNQFSNRLPNTLRLEIYNLSKATRERISEHGTSVRLDVGYGEALQTLFTGQLAHHVPVHEGTDWISIIYGWDTYIAMRESKVTISMRSGLSVRAVLEAVIASFGKAGAEFGSVGIEHLDEITLLSPVEMSGPSKDAMDRLAADYGFGWGFLDGRLEVWGQTSHFDDDAIEISASTGMVKSPVVTDLGVEVTTLLNPAVKPRRQIIIKSVGANVRVGSIEIRKKIPTLHEGTYTVGEVVFEGDTRGPDWYSRIKTYRKDALPL